MRHLVLAFVAASWLTFAFAAESTMLDTTKTPFAGWKLLVAQGAAE